MIFIKGTELTNSQNDARTFVKPKPDLTRRRTRDKNATKTIRKADREIPSDETQILEKGNKTKTIRKKTTDETKVRIIFHISKFYSRMQMLTGVYFR